MSAATSAWLPTAITGLFTVLVAGLAFWGTRGKTRADANTATTGQLIQGWADQATKLQEKLAEAEGRLDALEAEADDANRRASEAERRLRDAQDTLAASMRWAAALVAHIHAGYPPPPPEPPWQVTHHRAQIGGSTS